MRIDESVIENESLNDEIKIEEENDIDNNIMLISKTRLSNL